MPDDYVTSGSWTDPPGRGDHIDEVADQFERPSGAEEFWTGEQAGWPGRRADPLERMHRRAG